MTASVAMTPAIVEPGVYTGMNELVYHSDPVPGGSLSSSGARKLLEPSCPAIFAWEREHGRADTPAFDMGHAAHKLVLGVGSPIVEVKHDSWRTKEAQQKEALIRFEGGIPLLSKVYAEVHAMAEAIKNNALAMSLFSAGQPEASLFAVDDETGVIRRSRLDWLPESTSSGRMIIADYKTAITANPAAFSKSAEKYGYHQQGTWYPDVVKALDLAEDIAFVFVVQMKTPPYLVSVVELDDVACRIGRHLNRKAIDLYARCVADDDWPGYSPDEVAPVSLPGYYTRQFEELL